MDMRRTAFVLLLWSVITVSCAGATPPATRPTSFPLPASKKDCAACHLTEGTKTSATLKKAPSDLCLECHPDRVAPQEHRVGIPLSPAPKKLPLADGKITCVTCHDPHTNPYGSLLRMPETELCLVCHPY